MSTNSRKGLNDIDPNFPVWSGRLTSVKVSLGGGILMKGIFMARKFVFCWFSAEFRDTPKAVIRYLYSIVSQVSLTG